MEHGLLYIMLAFYLGATVLLGYLGYRHTRSSKDYLIAGGNIHPFLMALAYGSTFISTSAIVGFGGAAGVYGMSLLWLTVFNIFVGIFIAFVFYGVKTRKLAHQLGVHTFPEFLGARFSSPFIRNFSAGVIALSMPLYAAAVMIGGARYMEEAMQLNYTTSMIIFAVIVLAYVFFGGLRGVIYNDALQSSIMFIGMGVLLYLTYDKLGGVVTAHEKLSALKDLVPQALAAKGHLGWTAMPRFGSEIWWFVVSTLVLGVGIGVLAQPQLAVRYMTVSGKKEIYRALSVGGVFILFMTGTAFTVGALSNVYFMEQSGKLALAATAVGGAAPNVDKIIPLFITQAMPEWIMYLFLLSLMAAAMSTLSGQFHLIATSLTYDLNPKAKKGDQKTLLWARVGTVIGFTLTLLLALQLPPSIIAIATALFFGMCASAFLPMYTAALYWPKVTPAGATWSMISATVTYLVLVLFVHEKEAAIFGVCQQLFGAKTLAAAPWTYIDPMVISLPVSAVVLVAVSLMTQKAAQADTTLLPKSAPRQRQL
ncbi:na+/solute symporter [Heliomicrobium modesticaldum Ice1]|uniref:Na+/solute symporter n=1 Tax=Heliobacterium modesticaldum (strain ATCC 51547 / Ice1) TaxID=498761 RepID=B0TF34_HELMI|nr:sodium:solute symporter family protein [Heliomicrobium modesticaldum]ABZ83017.1 na+/solute symporter [Heliomicrobium modesticaldum Ice1]